MLTSQTKALNPDPVVDFLERIRDSHVSTHFARELAQRAIDRLVGARTSPPMEVIDELLAQLGTWRVGPSAVVSDRPQPGCAIGNSGDEIGAYGGYVMGETMGRTVRILVSHVPELLRAARHSDDGQTELARIAHELQAAAPAPRKVFNRIDACVELSALADDLRYADLDGAAEVLRLLAAAVLQGDVPALSTELRRTLRMRERS